MVLELQLRKVETLSELCSRLEGKYFPDRKACVVPNAQLIYNKIILDSEGKTFITINPEKLPSVSFELNKKTLVIIGDEYWVNMVRTSDRKRDIISSIKNGIVTILDKGEYYVVYFTTK